MVMTDNIIQFKVIEKAKPTKSKDFENKPASTDKSPFEYAWCIERESEN